MKASLETTKNVEPSTYQFTNIFDTQIKYII